MDTKSFDPMDSAPHAPYESCRLADQALYNNVLLGDDHATRLDFDVLVLTGSPPA